MKQTDYLKQYKLPLLVIIVITSIRVLLLYQSKYNLYADEAQYYDWSQNLAFGYYSKPPMIAWVIRFTTAILGNSEAAIRIASPIIHSCTSIVMYYLTKKIYSQKISYYAAIIYLLLPAVSFSSTLITTDAILLFFYALTILCFLKEQWIMAGIFFGFGLLTKYNMILFIPCAAIYLYWKNGNFCWMKKPGLYLALIIGLIIYAPNFYWNAKYGFVSYFHTKEISHIDKMSLNFKGFFEFLLTQIAIVGPCLAYCAINLGYKNIKTNQLVISFSLPILILISMLSLVSKAYGNWAAPCYIPLTIWIASFVNQKILRMTIVSNVLIAIIFYSYPLYCEKFNVNLYQRLMGWQKLGSEVNELASLHQRALIVTDDRKITAELLYYVSKKNKDKIRKWNPELKIKNHYDLTISIFHPQDEMILIFRNQIPSDFDYCKLIKLTPSYSISYCHK